MSETNWVNVRQQLRRAYEEVTTVWMQIKDAEAKERIAAARELCAAALIKVTTAAEEQLNEQQRDGG